MNDPQSSDPLKIQPRAPSAKPRVPSQREFRTVEDILRHDASLTSVPPNVQGRIEKSVARKASRRPWWKRLFGREN